MINMNRFCYTFKTGARFLLKIGIEKWQIASYDASRKKTRPMMLSLSMLSNSLARFSLTILSI